MDFDQWKAAAAAKLGDKYGIDARHIPEEVWCQFYATTMRRATPPSELPSSFRRLRPGGLHAPRVAWCEDSEVTA